ncbi:MAG: argininosuccinate synthase [Chloroflexi bacterium]|nr:argininosuccinate synthase [Chloroflexota bacterium]
MPGKVVLAYSGGLDTSVIIKWLGEHYDMEVIALTIDVGNQRDLDEIRERALKIGAAKAIVTDAKSDFVRHFIWPALRAGAVYEGQYPLATALSRPLIAKLMVDIAREEGATAVAHGCTGKGNDQVRFDVSVGALAPDLKVIAPVREWELKTREAEIEYAAKHNIPIPVTKWGRSIEAGVLEDPWQEPPEEVYLWTKAVADTPDQPETVEIGFVKGIPVSLNGRELDGLELITELGEIAGRHGVGRIDHIENRLVGIKSREIYEAPAGVTLIKAHAALEAMTLSKPQLRMKERVAQEYADLIYNGLWFTAHHQDLAAYVTSTQRHVTGKVRVRFHKGNVVANGRDAGVNSLYSESLATYSEGDQFDQSAAVGFIHLWGLPVRVQAQTQLLRQPGGPMGITGPQE